jgi:NADPH:quinone reductase-like Zn-dependent oxidoreductase
VAVVSGVRIAVSASGVNRADLLQLAGDYRPPPGESAVPGLECAGTVQEDAGGAWAGGAPVAALLGSGGYGTIVEADPGLILDASGMDPLQAAALPEALGTAWWNLVGLADAQPGETVLVTGANSGVGHIAVQVAVELGLRPIAAVRGTRWDEELRALGAEHVVDVTSSDAGQALSRTAPEGVDIALDLVGAAVSGLVMPALRTDARWLVVGLLGGTSVELDLRDVIRRRLRIAGSSLRSLPAPTRRRIVAAIAEGLWPAARAGRIVARIDGAYDVGRQQEAHEHLARGGVLGKIVLTHGMEEQR